MKLLRILLLSIHCFPFATGWAQANELLDQVFANPPQQAQPRVMWMWMGRNVTREGITKDLEALKQAGFGGAMMFALADICTPWQAEIANSPAPELVAFTDPWWKLVRHAASESKRLGLDFGLGNCPGYETSGGKWIPAELSMQEVISSKIRIEGGGERVIAPPRPSVDPRANQMFPVIHPQTGEVAAPIVEDRKTFYRDIAVVAVPAEGTIQESQVIDLTSKLDAKGQLTWQAPPGSWEVIRFGHTTMGKQIQPAQWDAMGHECDKMNPKAVEFHLDHVIGKIRQHLGDLIGFPGLTNLHFDSYEAGEPSWTPRMREEFRQRRGYDLLVWLPVFAGREVHSADASSRFRSDFKKTIADLYRDIYYPTLKRKCHEAGIELSSEPYGGPWNIPEIVPQLDRVLTEFWSSGREVTLDQGNQLVETAWKIQTPVIEAEAFTGSPEVSQWNETPFELKRLGDAAFCLGVNRMMLHKFPHQPWPGVKPGIVMGQWGTHFSQNQTWWEPGKAWVRYLARSQAALQWGKIKPLAAGEFSAPEGVRAIRRSMEGTELFFVANLTKRSVKGNVSFPITDRVPELWDPVRGTKRDLPDFTYADGKTLIPLEFAALESFFLVFREPMSAPAKQKAVNFPLCNMQFPLSGSWNVAFDPKVGGPEKLQTFSELIDWTSHTDPTIRYFSGTATYYRRFSVPASALMAQELDLGAVHHLAHVSLNGKDLGVVWTAPWRVALPPGVLREKSNELIIQVTNVWSNRLIGDEQHPDDCEWTPGPRANGKYLKAFPNWFVKKQKRPSSQRVGFTTWNYFTKDSPLTSSGLLGPVRLMWSSPTVPIAATVPSATFVKGQQDGFEADVVHRSRIIPQQIQESGPFYDHAVSADAAPLFNLTTRNGSGGGETLRDDKTYRPYGSGNALLMKFSQPNGVALRELQTFAGHADGRASQSYQVWIALANDPEQFIKVADVDAISDGGSSRVVVPLNQSNIAQVKIEFQDGPLGTNVYREMVLVPQP